MDSGYLDIGLLVYKKELESDTPKWIFGGGADSAPPRSPHEFNMPDLIGLIKVLFDKQERDALQSRKEAIY